MLHRIIIFFPVILATIIGNIFPWKETIIPLLKIDEISNRKKQKKYFKYLCFIPGTKFEVITFIFL